MQGESPQPAVPARGACPACGVPSTWLEALQPRGLARLEAVPREGQRAEEASALRSRRNPAARCVPRQAPALAPSSAPLRFASAHGASLKEVAVLAWQMSERTAPAQSYSCTRSLKRRVLGDSHAPIWACCFCRAAAKAGGSGSGRGNQRRGSRGFGGRRQGPGQKQGWPRQARRRAGPVVKSAAPSQATASSAAMDGADGDAAAAAGGRGRTPCWEKQPAVGVVAGASAGAGAGLQRMMAAGTL